MLIMIKEIFTSAVLAISSAVTAQAATFIEIYGGKENAVFRNTIFYDNTVNSSTLFRFAFYDNNDDYIFNSGDTTESGKTYEQLNHSSLGSFDYINTEAGIKSNGNVFLHISFVEYYSVFEYIHLGRDLEYYYLQFSGYTSRHTGDYYEQFWDGYLYNYYWTGAVPYEVKINGVSQVVPLPWPVALLPAGLALLGGVGRRRRVIG